MIRQRLISFIALPMMTILVAGGCGSGGGGSNNTDSDSNTERNTSQNDSADSAKESDSSKSNENDTDDTEKHTEDDSGSDGDSDTDTDSDSDTDSSELGDTATGNTDTASSIDNIDTATNSDLDTATNNTVDDEDTITGTWDTSLWDDELDTEPASFDGQKFHGVHAIDESYLMIHFVDGEVIFNEIVEGDCAYSNCSELGENTAVYYGDSLSIDDATAPSSWRITSTTDSDYGASGQTPEACFLKSKINGMAQHEWVDDDYEYEATMEHWIYLALPSPMKTGSTYTVEIDPSTNTDVTEYTFTYDIYSNRSEALHVNLVGYHPTAAIHAADLYHWMGDGGARDYSYFEGNAVYLYNVETDSASEVGEVTFWQNSANEFWNHNLIESPVWCVDFTGEYEPGIYRLAVEGVGASQDFVLGDSALFEPYKVSVLGFFYMRIGQDNMDMTPVPRRPLWIPGEAPSDCKVIVTDMDPYHSDWNGNEGRWDHPEFFADYVKAGSPENPNAKGGHSDALDWDRRLEHVSIIYDLLLPYILTDGVIGSDSLGIAESGNGIPDIIDEARNEVDFWLSLRYDGGYGHGVTNPNSSTHVLYQADNTAIAAWANAANASMLAAALRMANKETTANEYLQAALEAWTYVNGLDDQMLNEGEDLGSGIVTGRDFRMTAAAWLYHLTGETDYEDIMAEDSLISSGTSEFMTDSRNQLYAMVAYLHTDKPIHYTELQNNMREAVIYQADEKEVSYSKSRASRRASDQDYGWFHTTQNVQRTIVAHSVATDADDLARFERAMVLEASWGLGRNPANRVQMTTATTRMQNLRSIENAYTSGWNDGTPGVHPGHTPYLNIYDWGDGMIMGRPSWMTEQLYPNVDLWPDGELYFNTRYVYAYAEFTPQQTMRGKMALYGYLLGMKH